MDGNIVAGIIVQFKGRFFTFELRRVIVRFLKTGTQSRQHVQTRFGDGEVHEILETIGIRWILINSYRRFGAVEQGIKNKS